MHCPRCVHKSCSTRFVCSCSASSLPLFRCTVSHFFPFAYAHHQWHDAPRRFFRVKGVRRIPAIWSPRRARAPLSRAHLHFGSWCRIRERRMFRRLVHSSGASVRSAQRATKQQPKRAFAGHAAPPPPEGGLEGYVRGIFPHNYQVRGVKRVRVVCGERGVFPEKEK